MGIHLVKATENDLQIVMEILNYRMRNKIQRGDIAWGMKDLSPEPNRKMILENIFYIAHINSKPDGVCALAWQDVHMWETQPNDAG